MTQSAFSIALSPSASFSSYLAHVNAFPKLSKEQEVELARQYREEGCLESARQLVMCNLRYVIPTVKPYFSFGLAKTDIVQEGNIGLMKAAKLYDPSHNVRLISFAVKWIKAEVHEFVIKNWRIVKLATTKAQRKLFFNLSKFKKDTGLLSYEQKQEVAEALDVSEKDVSQMEARLYSQDESFSATTIDEQYLAPEAKMGASSLASWETDRDTEKLMHHVQDALRDLSERERMIISARWLSEKKAPLKELAKVFDVSMERVRQIEKSALREVKAKLEAAGFEGLLT